MTKPDTGRAEVAAIDTRELLRASLLVCSIAAFSIASAGPEWTILKPSNTGIPGVLVDVVRAAPDGRLWVAAHESWRPDGGIGVLDPATNAWTTYSNWDSPLPSNFVNDLAFGPGGVVWIATENGLVKKVGDSWTVYTTANAPLLHNTIQRIDLDAAGHVWLNNSNPRDNNAAIFKFDGSSWQKFQVGQQLPWSPPWNALNDVMVDHNGHVWVTNKVLNGVAEYNGTSWTLRGANVDRFDGIEEDTAGNIWLQAGVGGWDAFYKYDHATFTTYSEPTTPTAIGIGDDGTVYLGNWDGRVRKSTNGGQTWTDYLTGLNHVFSIEPGPKSTEVWIGTQGAVGQFLGDGSWKRDFNTWNTGIPDYFIEGMSKDREGNFWVASGEGGLSRFDGARWRNWGAHNVRSEPYPFGNNEPMGASYQDRQGFHWMGGNGIARWTASGGFDGFWNWENNAGMTPALITFFAEDAAGNLFAADQDGEIFRFDGGAWVREPVSPFVSIHLPGMKADTRGNVWVAGTYALFKWDGQSWSMVGDEYLFFDWGGVNVLSVGPDDTLWIGTGSGLARWDGVDLTLLDTSNSPLPANAIRGIDVREDGTLGIAASDFGSVTPFPNGVALVRGDPAFASNWTVHSYGESPLPHYQLGNVAFDARGSLWISTVSEGATLLRGCASRGWVNLVRQSYACGASVEIGITDCDVNADPNLVETVLVRVTSTTETDGEIVSLREIAADAGVFMGALPLQAADGPGVLRVRNGDVVAVSYLDASDGSGGQNIVRTDTAIATCPLASFGQNLRALDKVTFGWDAPSNVDWVRGDLSQVATYGILDFLSAAGATSIPAVDVPAPGAAFYWIVRVDGPLGSWSSGDSGECRAPGACPAGGRDANLPVP
jgi:ligand-binding sensor domain-containing protein